MTTRTERAEQIAAELLSALHSLNENVACYLDDLAADLRRPLGDEHAATLVAAARILRSIDAAAARGVHPRDLLAVAEVIP